MSTCYDPEKQIQSPLQINYERKSLLKDCKAVLTRQPLIGISPIQKVLGYKFSRNTDAMVYLIFKAELSVVKPARDN